MTDIDSIEWEDPALFDTPKVTTLTYNKNKSSAGGTFFGDSTKKQQDKTSKLNLDRSLKIYCDLSRVCEVEDAVVEWYDP